MNLWAEYDNEHMSTESIRHKPTRRPTEQLVLSATRQWLLQDYAASYCRALAALRIYRRCYWIDAWGIDTRSLSSSTPSATDPQTPTPPTSAPAKGRKKDIAQPTPPMLQPILALSQELAQESRPIALHGLVLQAGSSKRKETRATLNGNMSGSEDSSSTSAKRSLLPLPKESAMLPASWLEIAPTLLKEIEHSPAIFLLNPFALFTYDDLAPLYQRTTAPTELCLLIPHKQAELRLLSAARTPASASALTALLRTDRWKTLLPKDEETAPDLDGLIDLLLKSMQQHFLRVQRIALPIQIRPALVETAPYTLLFATRSKDSLTSMNDAVCRYRHRLYEQSARGILGEDWFASQYQERLAAERQQLYQRIVQQGQTQRPRRWPDFRQQLLLANFGQFALSDYDAIIDQLLRQGDLRCEWRRKPSEGEEHPIPGNDDLLLWK